MYQKILAELKELRNPGKAQDLARFFKTGKGEYGEGDYFWGIPVPETRKVAIKFKDVKQPDVKKLLVSNIHEQRLCGLLILVHQFETGFENEKRNIYNFYVKQIKHVNSWDLVDLSAPKIVGAYLEKEDRAILYELAESESLWERRVSILATHHFIKQKDFKDALKISEILLKDEEDLIHKAVGWMLREIGKEDQSVLEKFLKKHKAKMPRTMLRYAIEKFDEEARKEYMEK